MPPSMVLCFGGENDYEGVANARVPFYPPKGTSLRS